MENRDKRNTTILYISVGLCLFLYLSTYLLNSSKDVNTDVENNAIAHEVAKEAEPAPKPKKKKIIIIKQPTSHISYMRTHILREIIIALYVKREMCTPEDFSNEEKHRIPPKAASKTAKVNEPRTVLVIYIALGLLMISFGAALLDLFRAKSEMKANNDKKKPGLTRKCSLADLTVLRHSRKENMRKDSVYEGDTSKVTGASLLSRRCSFPTCTKLDYTSPLSFGEFRRPSLVSEGGGGLGDVEPKHAHHLILRRK